jgi:hypothetical protein
MQLSKEQWAMDSAEFKKYLEGHQIDPKKKALPEIEHLSELQSQQISLLGYIQQEDVKWYLHERSTNLQMIMSSATCVPNPDRDKRKFKVAQSHSASLYYCLTTDQNFALSK